MTKSDNSKISRRLFATSAVAFGLAAPSVLRAQDATDTDTVDIRTNNYSIRTWQGHFSSLRNGAILVDTQGRTLHFWPEDEAYHKIYPVSVPLTPELTRLGRTSIVRKRVGPDWRPTPSMLIRNPEYPEYIAPGPENPLGTHALYLGWTYYRIHGTNDTRKIGRQSSNGCIGLYNEQIEELFGLAKVGTQVLLI
ncbi:MAG: L,D-transpeptidase [Alphaproteobacteria bacterium]